VRTRMSWALTAPPLATLLVLAVLAVSGPARADYPLPLIFGRLFGIAPDDLPAVREASQPLFDAGAAPGTVKEWSNAKTGHTGSVKLRGIFDLKGGIPCRTFDYVSWTQHHSFQSRLTVDWCQVEQGQWKLVAPRNP
jgi:hypothetical protein